MMRTTWLFIEKRHGQQRTNKRTNKRIVLMKRTSENPTSYLFSAYFSAYYLILARTLRVNFESLVIHE